MKRRDFVRNSVLAMGATSIPVIVPAYCATTKQGRIPPSDRIRMGGIGLGGMGRGDMNRFISTENVEYVAMCDVDMNQIGRAMVSLKERGGDVNGVSVYGDFREFLEKEELDAVHIATPDHWHAIPAIAAANKGLHIYGQKPLARSIKEGRAMVEAVERNNIVWQTGSQQRSRPNFLKACEIVRNGKLGKITHVEVGLPDGGHKVGQPAEEPVPQGVDWKMWLGPAPIKPYRGVLHGKWRWILDYSGGQLTDWAGHHVDIAHWGLDLDRTGPIEIEGVGQYNENDLFDVPYFYDLKFKYANGLKMNVASRSKFIKARKGKKGWEREKENQVGMGAVWYGENGWLQVNRAGIWAENPEVLDFEIGSGDVQLYKSPGHHMDFINCVRFGKEPVCPAEIGHRSISVALLGEIAMTTGERLKWNPKSETFIGASDHASAMLMKPYHNSWELPKT
ncbi:MAG: Gfo/Idh/MocA family oxidoreductase [Bacteroidota bacterium]